MYHIRTLGRSKDIIEKLQMSNVVQGPCFSNDLGLGKMTFVQGHDTLSGNEQLLRQIQPSVSAIHNYDLYMSRKEEQMMNRHGNSYMPPKLCLQGQSYVPTLFARCFGLKRFYLFSLYDSYSQALGLNNLTQVHKSHNSGKDLHPYYYKAFSFHFWCPESRRF